MPTPVLQTCGTGAGECQEQHRSQSHPGLGRLEGGQQKKRSGLTGARSRRFSPYPLSWEQRRVPGGRGVTRFSLCVKGPCSCSQGVFGVWGNRAMAGSSHSLDQGLPNCGLWAKSCPLIVFVFAQSMR